MAFFDFLNNMGIQDLFKFQPQGMQGTSQALPWQNPDTPMAPNQLNPGFGQSVPWQNPDAQQPNQQDNLRRMILMQQMMGQNQQGEQPQASPLPVNPPMQSPSPQMPGRFNQQMAQNPQAQQLPAFAQPRIARFLGANRSLGY